MQDVAEGQLADIRAVTCIAPGLGWGSNPLVGCRPGPFIISHCSACCGNGRRMNKQPSPAELVVFVVDDDELMRKGVANLIRSCRFEG